eukprot:1140332-Pelagomonas_calceolata.AAC.3
MIGIQGAFPNRHFEGALRDGDTPQNGKVWLSNPIWIEIGSFWGGKGLVRIMVSQAPSSSSNPLARWLKPVTPTQQLFASQARLAKAKASRKGQLVKQKDPVGHPSGGSSVDVACMSSRSKNAPKPLQPPAPEHHHQQRTAAPHSSSSSSSSSKDSNWVFGLRN